MVKLQQAQTGRKASEDKVYGCRDTAHALAILDKLNIEWECRATLRIGHKWDVIAGRHTAQLGVATHYLSDDNRLLATYSQSRGAMVVYMSPHKLGKIYLTEYNIVGRD